MDEITLFFAGLFGLIIGSFLNVCIYRIPNGKSIVWPASFCPKCGKSIKWYDNIPVLSYILLWGKCRNCKEPISCQYPLVELLTGVPSCFMKHLRHPLELGASLLKILVLVVT